MSEHIYCSRCDELEADCVCPPADGGLVVLPAGAKIKADGGRYQTTATVEVPAEMLPEGKKQTNPRVAVVCPNDSCREYQRSVKRGRLMVIYATPKDLNTIWHPACGGCNTPMRIATADEVKPTPRQ